MPLHARLKLRLKPGREKALSRGHPWIFSGAIDQVDPGARAGQTLDVFSASDQFLAQAAFSPTSQIRARVWTTERDVEVDAAFLGERIAAALGRRTALRASDAVRLVHGEADGLPGLIVDRYGEVIVVQFLSQGSEHHRDVILALLLEHGRVSRIYERSDADVRALEGLAPRCGSVRGAPFDTTLQVTEHGLAYTVDIAQGQKTGFYIDQRDNRRRVLERARGEVLNCFCYTGGFSLAALKAGADRVTSIDSSSEALDLARANARQNGFPEASSTWLCNDVFAALRTLRDSNRQFDTIVLDPPKFAPSPAHLEKAARAYKDINLLGLKLLRPGGLLFTFSCSGGVSAELFQKIVAGAASDASATVQIIERLFAPSDHPVLLNFPEGDYLKGLVLEKRA